MQLRACCKSSGDAIAGIVTSSDSLHISVTHRIDAITVNSHRLRLAAVVTPEGVLRISVMRIADNGRPEVLAVQEITNLGAREREAIEGTQ